MTSPYDNQHTSVRHSKEEAYTECTQMLANLNTAAMRSRGTYEPEYLDLFVSVNRLWMLTRSALASKMNKEEYAALESLASDFLSRRLPEESRRRDAAIKKNTIDGLKFADCLMKNIDQKGVVVS